MMNRPFPVSAMILGLGACVGAASAGVIVHQQDFENAAAIGPEWSSAGTEHAAAFTRFSQRRTNETLKLTLDTMSGQAYSLVFDLYLFDSWDGGNATWGQDRFNVKAGSDLVFSELLDNSMNSPDQSFRNADQIGQLAFGNRDADRDSIYRAMVLEFTAIGASTQISFFGSGLQGKSDESWGIDNVMVEAVPAPATAALLGAGAMLAGRRRRS